MKLLDTEPAVNLFIIGDIENFGYQQDFQDLWGDWHGGSLRAVLLRYYDAYVPYAREADYDRAAFLSLIRGRADWQVIHGKKSIVEYLVGEGEVEGHQYDKHFCELTALALKPAEVALPAGYELIRCGRAHVDGIVRLHSICFGHPGDRMASRQEAIHKELADGNKSIWAVQTAGQIVSTAETAAENSRSAMIIGVCTHPEHRQRGLASSCLYRLCEEQLNQRRSMCLFYDNPEAGTIYKRLGFKDIGTWTMIERRRAPSSRCSWG